jgi:hypothetical protein
LVGTPIAATGKVDGAVNFPGMKYIYLGNPAMPTSPITVSAWCIPNSVGDGNIKTFVSKGYDGSTTQWDLFNPAYSTVVTFNTYNGGTTKSVSSSSGVMVNGTWVYIAAVYDGTTWRMYINGAPDGTSVAGGPVANGAKLEFGAVDVAGSPAQYAGGTLDEVRISNVARSAGWILTEYRNQSAPGTYISEGSQQTYSGSVRVAHSVREGE